MHDHDRLSRYRPGRCLGFSAILREFYKCGVFHCQAELLGEFEVFGCWAVSATEGYKSNRDLKPLTNDCQILLVNWMAHRFPTAYQMGQPSKYRLWNMRWWNSTNSWILSKLDHSLDVFVNMKLHWRCHIIPQTHANTKILKIWKDGATRTPTTMKNKVAVELQKSRGLGLVIQNFMRGISTTSPLLAINHGRFITWLVLGGDILVSTDSQRISQEWFRRRLAIILYSCSPKPSLWFITVLSKLHTCWLRSQSW